MKIAKCNISIGEHYFDKGQEVTLPKDLLEQVKDLIEDAPDKPVKEKAMTTDSLKDKKLKDYKDK